MTLISIPDKDVLFIGLDHKSLPTIEFLLASHHNLTICLINNSDFVINKLKENENVKFAPFSQIKEVLNENYSFILRSSSISPHISFLKHAASMGHLLISEIELLNTVYPRFIGITTNSEKSFSSSLIHTLLQGECINPILFQKNGPPLLHALNAEAATSNLIVELSNQELKGEYGLKPYISVLNNLLNPTSNRSNMPEESFNITKNLVRNQKYTDFCIYNIEDATLRRIAEDSLALKVPYSIQSQHSLGACIRKGFILFNGEPVIHLKDLYGKINASLEDTLAAICVAKIYRVSNESIKRSFNNLTAK